MNTPPMVTPRIPYPSPGAPSGTASGAPLAVAGAVAGRVLGCPPGLTCTEIAPTEPQQLQAADESWPTWAKVLVVIAAISVVVIGVSFVVARRYR